MRDFRIINVVDYAIGRYNNRAAFRKRYAASHNIHKLVLECVVEEKFVICKTYSYASPITYA